MKGMGMDKKSEKPEGEMMPKGKGGGNKVAGMNFCKECGMMTEGEYCSHGCKMRAGKGGEDAGGM